MESRWKRTAFIVINSVYREHPEATEHELRKLVSAAYPFGERDMHPYKVWCAAVKYQFSIWFPKATPIAEVIDGLFECASTSTREEANHA